MAKRPKLALERQQADPEYIAHRKKMNERVAKRRKAQKNGTYTADRVQMIKRAGKFEGGRLKYKPEFIKQVATLSAAGHTDREMAAHLCVSETTFNIWKYRYPEFGIACERSKAIEDKRVLNAFYARAAGEDRQEGFDTNAAKFWMQNRSVEWRALMMLRNQQPAIQQQVISIDLSKLDALSPKQLNLLQSVLKKVDASKLIEHDSTEGEDKGLSLSEHDEQGDEYAATLR